MKSFHALLAAIVIGVLGASGCSSDNPGAAAPTSATGPTTTTAAVRSEVYADLVDPPGAEGRKLSLVRYTIAPGAKLVPHVHPGVQMARIESGTLTYTIESGTALVRRAGSTTDEPETGPTTITLEVGDAVIEQDNMVHFGENRSSKELVIIAALLTKDGMKLAEPVTTTSAPD
ncbi:MULTISPECIES: cupin domain-containing protein [Candidatus Neomicrothrix]|jgi:quercetin dioxygenase-like cupin family protein|uniref:Putative Cupin 2 conserved barrel domain protein n=1 Tax=Candidatus Neomicrothrix parvicella RN1 TaxID=1229780 RepID=R4Z194_9ACTN|nr:MULTISPECIES: cupin domain-containing protein [Microthrix]NLH64822.1 cupin domain-containing protein [Candidatus Microthrix parvicella]MBK6502742.1 cupin domain-containing protein [Candidatus Microthrix sp.]MBK7021848.1 cupin domain-containing protein [Candidatus Microthrix sp.]MBP6133966.1 cupin domain-containing protein [Candidatus Microthrix sp.]MBP6148759.1 cupin domain-containing protein [Candidatus Microthrix sp.]